jgi:hypothetical protein
VEVLMSETIVVANGPLLRLKEMIRSLEADGIEGRVLPPEGGCSNK